MRGLEPIAPAGARILVLGSFPSACSLERGEYYAHDRNHFWEILALLAGEPRPGTRDARIELLGRLGIALWDVIAACDREGSLDQAIRNEEPNPVPTLLASLPVVSRIALNGGKAASGFAAGFAPALRGLPIGAPAAWNCPALGGRSFLVARLPSTSPIPTARFRSAEDKLPPWRDFLLGAEGQAQGRVAGR